MQIELISPFPFASLPRAYGWIQRFREQVADDFAPRTLSEFVEQMATRWETEKTWAIYRDKELGGLIMFQRLSPWRGTAQVILKQPFQGRGVAAQAFRQAVGEMFAEGIGKLEFYILSPRSVGSLIVTIGGRREARLEAHTLRNGKPADLWVYGLTKQEFEAQHGLFSGPVLTNHTDHHGQDQPVRHN